MIKNYFKTSWRNLIRAKGYAILNIGGLSIGMAGAMLIFLWAFHEKSYDRFFAKSDRICQLWSQAPVEGKKFSFEYSPEVLASSLQKNVPEIEAATSYVPLQPLPYQYRDKKLTIATAIIDPSFFKVFDFAFAKGDGTDFFRNPASVILTESTARMIFGTTDAIGKTIHADQQYPVQVTAILKDLPNNTDFIFKVLLPRILGKTMGRVSDSWESFEAQTYVVPGKHTTIGQLAAKIRPFMHPFKTDVAIDLYLLPLTKRHLQDNFEDGRLTGGKIVMVNGFMLAGLLLLGIACINFMNLSTAKSEKRALEVGIRKVTGASRPSLIAQFLVEAILMALISGILALAWVFFTLPFFNGLTGEQIRIPVTEPVFWLYYTGFVLTTGLLAGSYPAFLLSSFNPVKILKGALKGGRSGWSLRRVLVVSQFSVAIALIIGTVVIYSQIMHGRERNAGYERSRLIYTSVSDVQQRNEPAIREELLSSGLAGAVSATFTPITEPNSMGNGYIWEGFTGTGTSSILFLSFPAGKDLLITTGIRLLAGRDLDITHFPTDSSAMLVNEAAAKAMNMRDPLNKWVEGSGKRWHIVGLVKDFVLESPFQKIQPLFITGPLPQMSTLHIRITDKLPVAEALVKIGDIFRKFDPAAAFEPHFVDEEYAQKFSDEQREGKLSLLFAGLSIFVSCLGLFGLAAYTAAQRSKEIGVRKVLGATVGSIVRLLSKDFVRLVALSLVIASPFAYYIMNAWLDSFSYRISIGWQVFAITGGLAVLIAVATVSFQAIRAAVANPVDSLRNE